MFYFTSNDGRVSVDAIGNHSLLVEGKLCIWRQKTPQAGVVRSRLPRYRYLRLQVTNNEVNKTSRRKQGGPTAPPGGLVAAGTRFF